MLTDGRLRRILAYLLRHRDDQSVAMLAKFGHELYDEVKWLRAALDEVQDVVTRYRQEPALGPPDFVERADGADSDANRDR